MKILVTGAAGFVGQRLCGRLVEGGHEVIAVVHPDSMERATATAGCNLELLPVDLSHLKVSQLPSRADVVVTLGQARNFRDFPARAEETFAVNVLANLRILEWAIGAGVRKLVHASSGGIYGGQRDRQLQETDLLAVDSPLGFYLGTKLCAEIVVQNFRQFFETTVILRPFFIYGPRQKKNMFVARIIESVRNGVPVVLQGAGGLRINPVFVDDAAEAFARALDLSGCHVINVAGPDIMSLRSMCERVGTLLGRRPIFEDKAGPPTDYIGDTAQALAKLRFKLTPFDVGIRTTLEARER